MIRRKPDNFGNMIPDPDGIWISCSDVAALEREIVELKAAAIINTRYCAEVIERCAGKADDVAFRLSNEADKAKESDDHKTMYKLNTAWHAAVEIARDIRALIPAIHKKENSNG